MASGHSPTASCVLLMLGTALSLYGGSQAASTGSATEEPFVLSPHCEPVNRFRHCWVNHHDLPSCGNEKSLTVTCGERVGRTMAKCDQDKVIKYSGALLRQFKASDKILCDEREMHEAFQNDGYCWMSARTCAKKVIFSKTYTYDCQAVKELHRECLEEDVSQHCAKFAKLYTKAVLAAHPCSGAAIVPPTVLIFLLVVIIFVSRTEF